MSHGGWSCCCKLFALLKPLFVCLSSSTAPGDGRKIGAKIDSLVERKLRATLWPRLKLLVLNDGGACCCDASSVEQSGRAHRLLGLNGLREVSWGWKKPKKKYLNSTYFAQLSKKYLSSLNSIVL